MQSKLAFMIIGAQKSGTTSLYDLLRQHERLFLPELSEMPFFVEDEFFAQGQPYLDAYFSAAAPGQVLGAKHPRSMKVPTTAARLHAHNDKLHVFAVLREPVARAYSAYWFERGKGIERHDTFEAAIAAKGSDYLSRGHYADQLQPYFELFGPEQVHVYLTSELKSDTRGVISGILDTLGISGTEGIDFASRSNQSAWARSVLLSRLLVQDSSFKAVVRAMTTPRMRYWLQHRIRVPLVRWNRKTFRYPPMDEAIQQRLKQYYQPHNRRLGQLLGRDLSEWS